MADESDTTVKLQRCVDLDDSNRPVEEMHFNQWMCIVQLITEQGNLINADKTVNVKAIQEATHMLETQALLIPNNRFSFGTIIKIGELLIELLKLIFIG